MTTTNNSTQTIQPYLFFDGRADEAVEFYRDALGAEVTTLLRFRDTPENDGCAPCMPVDKDKVMHMSFRIGNTTVLASDGQCLGKPDFQGFSLSITAANEDEAERLFEALAEGGQVQMPLAKTFFSPRFGMVGDRFGVFWMIYVAPLEGV